MADSESNVEAVPADKADLVLQASWEIDAIARMMHDHLPIDAEALVYRSMMRRCRRLASMVMSAIGETNMGTPELQAMFDDGEVARV